MNHDAPVGHPVLEAIARKWSPRAFSPVPVNHGTILSLLEAARWAPSAYNEQPWRFLVAMRGDGDAFDLALSCLVEGNVRWAKEAHALMFGVTKRTFSHNGAENRWAFHDLGMAIENMAVQAASMGLFVHPMAGFSVERIRNLYRVPEGFDPVTAMAVGYAGDPAQLPDDLRERETAPRTRMSLEDTVFEKSWGVPFPK